MVYCGKPSRGCQMCRTRRIKCDETKPTCSQCQKSRRQCPGYKDDFDLVFRNETQATERRARKAVGGKKGPQITFTNAQTSFSVETEKDGEAFISPTSDSGMLIRYSTPPRTLDVPVDQQAPCYFMANFVINPANAVRGHYDFLVPMLKNERPDSAISLAFSAVALASLAGRPSARGTPWFGQSCMQYTKALKATNLALQNPAQQKADSTLAAIIMLGFFENMASEKSNASAWYSHVEGAVQLVKMRGKKQLRTKAGYSLFVCVRDQMCVQCMSSSKAPALGGDWWIAEDGQEDIGIFTIKLNLLVAELRHEINTALATYARTPENIQKVMNLMKRAQAMEQEYQAWNESLPDNWRPQTVAWVDQLPNGDITKADVCPGKVDMFDDVWIAKIWNHSRVARLFVSGAIVRCAAWICAPVDYRTTPEYAQSVRLCVDLVTDIIASIPYQLGWRVGLNGSLMPANLAGDGSGEAFNAPKAIGGFFCLWPLFACSNSDYSSDSQRLWAKGRLGWIAENLGLKHAKVLASFQLRLPSMIIRRDSMLHTPPSAQLLATAAAARSYHSPPAQTQAIYPSISPSASPQLGQTQTLTGPYTLNPLQQREAMQREAWARERNALLKKASNEQGDSMERLVSNYLAV